MSNDLFNHWLRETRELQINSFGRDPVELSQDEREQFVLWNSYAAIDEIGEAMDEISWKPWASAKFFNRDQFVNELVDVLHFVGNLLAAADCSDEELDERYLSKMQKNRDRQSNGYTGTDKCPKCKRAFDDVGRGVCLDLCTICVSESLL